MDTSKLHDKKNSHSKIEGAADHLLKGGKKFADSVYKDGVDKLNAAEEQLEEYSDELLKKVKENPLASVLIAGGIGFLLSKLLSK